MAQKGFATIAIDWRGFGERGENGADICNIHYIRETLLGKTLLAGMAVSLLGPASAQAALILSVQSATAAAGSSGNTFDVLLNNSGPSAVTIGGFSFGILTPNINISFRDELGSLHNDATCHGVNNVNGCATP